MTKVQMRTGVYTGLVHSDASDMHVVQSARVSNIGFNEPETDAPGLINYLMKHRHGTPFEHNSMTFWIEAPIFVFREQHRHRIASINEESGRYSKMRPKFYTPSYGRGLLNAGSSAHPDFVTETTPRALEERKREIDTLMSQYAWDSYEVQLKDGIAKEMARTILPLNLYSRMYWTINARSLMNFLSLRVDAPWAAYPSKPQWEIQLVATQLEKKFNELMPVTHEAFMRNGRVAP